MPARKTPPFVFPDDQPVEHDSDRAGYLWVVCGPIYTDGTGWRWEKAKVSNLSPGDIWVPCHTLHTRQIPAVTERARQLRVTSTTPRQSCPEEMSLESGLVAEVQRYDEAASVAAYIIKTACDNLSDVRDFDEFARLIFTEQTRFMDSGEYHEGVWSHVTGMLRIFVDGLRETKS